MRFLSKVLLPFTFLFLGTNPVKSDTTYFIDYRTPTPYDIFSITDNGSSITWTDITDFPSTATVFSSGVNIFYDPGEEKIYALDPDGDTYTYDITSDNWSAIQNSSNSNDYSLFKPIESTTQNSEITTNTSNISTNTSNISANASNIESLQGSSNTTDITANTNKINTNSANINKLGEGVAGSTALTAALSALPQTSKESKLSCGLGTGAYSSRYAVGFGCASKVNERVDINAGGSYVFGGSKSYGGGTLDSGVVKAGFVFKFGELNKPTEISFKDKKIIDKKIFSLQEDNKNLKAKNNEIISQNQKLLARLEKLENIALKFQTNLDVISMSK